uniref:Doublecortin domain-containing protein n=1 Tax=Podarcis muralis TaxID=64176 RepID=A0A670J057_PODMU
MVGATRPRAVYSLTDVTPARTIWVYRNGDPFYLGRKFVINHRYVPNFEAFMIQLNEGVATPFGVRKIYTPRQGHSVMDLTDIEQGGRYVVAGRERFRKLNLFICPFDSVFTNGDMLIPPVKILLPKFTLKSWNGVLGLINEKVSSRTVFFPEDIRRVVNCLQISFKYCTNLLQSFWKACSCWFRIFPVSSASSAYSTIFICHSSIVGNSCCFHFWAKRILVAIVAYINYF